MFNKLWKRTKEIDNRTAIDLTMSWSHANCVELPEASVASLMQRGLLFSTMTPDGMREAFGVTTEIFDVAKAECESGNLF